jgi:hypothetical protein
LAATKWQRLARTPRRRCLRWGACAAPAALLAPLRRSAAARTRARCHSTSIGRADAPMRRADAWGWERASPPQSGDGAPRWPSAKAALEGAKKLSAESLSQGNEALRKAAQHVVNESPHAAKVQEVTTGLWSRLPEAARKAAPPAAGALTVRARLRRRKRTAARAAPRRRQCWRIARAARTARQVMALIAAARGDGGNPALRKARFRVRRRRR